MTRANYREIAGPDGHLANLREFQGNTMRGEVNAFASIPPDTPNNISEADFYVISYNTLIAAHFPDGTVWVSDRKFSVTTSKHQGYCRAWLGHKFVSDTMPVEVR